MITIKSLQFKYSKSNNFIFKGTSVCIPEKSFIALLAPNGVGKTTLVKILTKQISNYTGEVKIHDEDLRNIKYNIYDVVSILTTDMKTPKFLTVAESIKFSLEAFDNYTEEKLNELIALFDLEEHRNKKISQLSSGLERRTELAQTLSNQSDLVILDEPCNALDYNSVVDTLKVIKKIKDLNKTIIYSTHQFSEVESLYTHCITIKDNKLSLVSREDINDDLHKYYSSVYKLGV